MDLNYIENMKFNKEVFLNLQKFVSKDIESLDDFNCSSIRCTECPFSYHSRGSEVYCCAIDESELRDIGEYYLDYFKGEMSKEDLCEMSKEDLGEMRKKDLVKVLVPGNIVEVSFTGGIHIGVVLNNSQVMYLDVINGFDTIPELLNEHEEYYINRVFEPIEGTTKESILQLEKLNCVYSRNTIKHPKDVPFGERYEMYYKGERYECRNELVFGKEIMYYGKSDGTSFAVPISWVGEKGIESIKLITD